MALIETGKRPSLPATTYYLGSVTITANDVPVSGVNNVYTQIPPGASIRFSAVITNELGEVQSHVDQSAFKYPPPLKMPVNKLIESAITGELFFNATITAGLITITGLITESGEWVAIIDRINAYIASAGAGFKFNHPDITFLI